jgi:hypothetical protein
MSRIKTLASFTVQTANGQFRSIMTALPMLETEMDYALPELCGSHCGAIGLTFTGAVLRDTVMDALLAVGWQTVNYVYMSGLWFKALDLLGTLSEPLGCEAEPASVEQQQLLYRVTKSHVFDRDRDAIRKATDKADIEQASKLIDMVLREVKTRKAAEKTGQPGQFSYAQAA